jgi:hypothetical protein
MMGWNKALVQRIRPYATMGIISFVVLMGIIITRGFMGLDMMSALIVFCVFTLGIAIGVVLMAVQLVPKQNISIGHVIEKQNEVPLRKRRHVRVLMKLVKDANKIIDDAAKKITGMSVHMEDIAQQIRTNAQQEENGIQQRSKASRYQLWQIFSQLVQESEQIRISINGIVEEGTAVLDSLLAAHKLIEDTMVRFYGEIKNEANDFED